MPSPLEDVAWSRETIEAHLAADVAEIAYEDARVTLAMVERGELGGEFDRAAVIAEAEQARERLASAQARYRELALRDASTAIRPSGGDS